jgi:hypothetical protein
MGHPIKGNIISIPGWDINDYTSSASYTYLRNSGSTILLRLSVTGVIIIEATLRSLLQVHGHLYGVPQQRTCPLG